MRFVFDSYAWIEYLDGSSKGEEVNKILKGDNEVYTLGMILAEVISRTNRQNKNVDIAYRAITLNSKTIEVDHEIAKEAGILHADIKKKIKNFGLIDAIILVSARKLKAKILTGDQHFKDFKESVFLK